MVPSTAPVRAPETAPAPLVGALGVTVCAQVWRGTATRLSDIHLQLFCDDPKSAEIELINQGLDYQVGASHSPHGEAVDVLSRAAAADPSNAEVQNYLGLSLSQKDQMILTLI